MTVEKRLGSTTGAARDPASGTTTAGHPPPADQARRPLVEPELDRQLAAAMAPGLYLVATPIGNLGDISLRALAVLARADVVYCEDTRRSRTLFDHFGLRTTLKPYHEHNAAEARPRILADLADGRRVALISDAGTPLVSDPGYKLVRAAAAAGHPVFAVPGASALLTALTCAGLPTDAFQFVGFLPPRSAARQARLESLKRLDATLVIYEAPQRIAATLHDLADVLGPRDAAVARELTKRYEEIVRGPLAGLAETFDAREARGEFVIVIAPPAALEASDADIARALAEALQDSRLKEAARQVADALGVSRTRVYDIGLRLKGERASDNAADGEA